MGAFTRKPFAGYLVEPLITGLSINPALHTPHRGDGPVLTGLDEVFQRQPQRLHQRAA